MAEGQQSWEKQQKDENGEDAGHSLPTQVLTNGCKQKDHAIEFKPQLLPQTLILIHDTFYSPSGSRLPSYLYSCGASC